MTDAPGNTTEIELSREVRLGPDGLPILPVIGLPGSDFYFIHVSAVVSLTISILASLGVICYMLKVGDTVQVMFEQLGKLYIVEAVQGEHSVDLGHRRI